MADVSRESMETALPLYSPLVALTGRDGGIRVWSSEWLGLTCSPRPTISISVGARSAAGLEPEALAWFGVSLPPTDLRVPHWLPALLAGAGNEVLASAGLSIALGNVGGAPLVAGCRLHFECRDGTLKAYPGAVLISGQVVAIHLPGKTLGSESWPELGRILPLANLSPQGPEKLTERT